MGGKTFDKDAIENLGYGFKRGIDTRIGGQKIWIRETKGVC